MRLASMEAGRDGKLVVVASDLRQFVPVPDIAETLQQALDNWSCVKVELQLVSDLLNAGRIAGRPFDPTLSCAPLPRAYQWLDGSAYLSHVELVRRARGADLAPSHTTDPLMYQGASDGFLSPRAPICLDDEDWGCDFEAEVCVVTGDVRQGASREEALEQILLIGLVNDVSLRGLIPSELSKGFGFVQSKPASALSPVLVTPAALGDAWREGQLHLPLNVDLNGRPFGRANAGEMAFDFGTLIAHAARTRSLAAGSIIGSGTVSNRGDDGGVGRPIDQGGRGYSCIAEVRMIETISSGRSETPYLRHGDTVRIEMLDRHGHSIFGAIEQTVKARSSVAPLVAEASTAAPSSLRKVQS